MNIPKFTGLVLIGAVYLIAQNVTAEPSRKILHKNPFIKPSVNTLSKPGNSSTANNQTSLNEMVLRGTLSSGTQAIANINGEMLTVGELINGYELKKVNIGSAVLVRNGKEEVLVVNNKYKELK